MGVITGGDNMERQPLLVVEKRRSNTAETVVSPSSMSFSDGNRGDVDGDDTYLAVSSSWGSTPFVTANWFGSTSCSISHKINRKDAESRNGSTTSQSENARQQQHSYQKDEWETNSLLPESLHLFHRKVIASVRAHTGSIGMLGSMAIAVNSLTGPAMLNLPATFAKSGILPTLFTLLFVCLLTCLCCLHLSNTISKVPDNLQFKQEVEFSQAFEHFWGRQWFLVTQVLFFCCITCLNISSIVDTAHVVDTFLGHWAPTGSVALKVGLHFPPASEWTVWNYSVCSPDDLANGDCLPFRDQADQDEILMTSGNLITSLVFLPLALMDLKENVGWQILGFFILLVTSLQFIIQFALADGFSLANATWWGYDWDDLLGVIMFNFALVIAIPAWLYEREAHVDVPTVIYSSSGLSVVLYIAIGLLGNMAMPNVSENMLESMMSGVMGPSLQFGASVFAFAIIGLGTPLFSVLTRLNLTGNGLCSRRMGNVLAVYLPFGMSWILYDSTKITKLLSWGGVIFTGLVAFILPLVLTYHVVQEFDVKGAVPVYGNLNLSKKAELNWLIVLLAITVISIIVAVAGNFIGD